MTDSMQAQTALLTEHFRYTPLTLLDDIINTVNELIYRAVNAIENGLSLASPSDLGFQLPTAALARSNLHQTPAEALDELKTNEIDTGIVQLESLLNATVDRDFDKFEIYTLRNILAVGHEDEGLVRWVRLEHYRHLDFDAAAAATAKDANTEASNGSPEHPTPESVQLQRRKLRETRKLNVLLREEEARNTALLAQLSALTGNCSTANISANSDPQSSPLAFLTTSPPLAQTTSYLLSSLPQLRTLLSTLKQSLSQLPNARHTAPKDDQNSHDAARRRYLDAQTGKAMERRGVVVDVAGKLAAGSGEEGSARRVRRDEILGLEGVVRVLKGGVADHRGEEMEE